MCLIRTSKRGRGTLAGDVVVVVMVVVMVIVVVVVAVVVIVVVGDLLYRWW